MNTQEERLARVEAEIAEIRRNIGDFKEAQRDMQTDLKKLLEAFNLGQGKAAAMAKAGGVILILITAGITVWEHILIPAIKSVLGN